MSAEGHATPAPAPAQAEAGRLMTICNACRYCEGLCAVFPAMERRRLFVGADLDYLANLCHNCGACLFDCQYAPPHEFEVAVPSALARLRVDTWQRYAWPQPLGALFARNGVFMAAAVAVSVAVFLIAIGTARGGAFFEAQRGPGAFYEVMPHGAVVSVFGAGLGFGLVSLGVSLRRYWRAIGGGPLRWADLAGAGASASTLEYLDGGGPGCMNDDDHPDDTRRLYHHATYYGFGLCLLATTLAAVLDTGFGQEAPYAWYHPVVVSGTVGGLGLIVGPIGLLRAKRTRAQDLGDPESRSMELAFLYLLLALSVSGLAVLVLRATTAMPVLLAVHLGVVFAFFVSVPYGKFVHGFYRYLALVKDRQERSGVAGERRG